MKYINNLKRQLILISITILIIIIYKSSQLIKNLKVCICVIVKGENKYIREFAQYYKNYGIDKIFLYDNNDPKEEGYENIISDYINNNFIEIINFRGKSRAQLESYRDCYERNYKRYNWFLFYDLDEFIYLKSFKNIKIFLNQKRFIKCQTIQLNWVFHTDNNLLYYDNRSLSIRFRFRKLQERGKKKGGPKGIKSIIRGNISTNISEIHRISPNLTSCDGFGNIRKSVLVPKISDLYYFYIDHYYCKSTEEFIQKLMKTDGFHNLTDTLKYQKLSVYFSINEITKKKLDFIENKTKLNLSIFRNKLKK